MDDGAAARVPACLRFDQLRHKGVEGGAAHRASSSGALHGGKDGMGSGAQACLTASAGWGARDLWQ